MSAGSGPATPPATMSAGSAGPNRAPQARAAAFFDLDHTVLATNSLAAFAPRFRAGGLTSGRALLRVAYAQLIYHLSSADDAGTERLRRALSRLVAGWDATRVNEIAARTLQEVIAPAVYAEALAAIGQHHQAGRDVVIVSASGLDIVAPIAAMVGADHVAASRLEIVDGRYTGVLDFYCYGPAKVQAIAQMATQYGYDLAACYAYSDSITDVPMLEAVGHATVVNPDRSLRKLAAARGWQVAHYSRPTPLRHTLRRTLGYSLGYSLRQARPALIGAGAGLAVGATAVVWVTRAAHQRSRP